MNRLSQFLGLDDEDGRAEWLDQYIDWDRILAQDAEHIDLDYLITIVNPSPETWANIMHVIALLSDEHQPMVEQERNAWQALRNNDYATVKRLGGRLCTIGMDIAQRNCEAWVDGYMQENPQAEVWAPTSSFRHPSQDLWHWFVYGVGNTDYDPDRALSALLTRIPDGEALERARQQIRQIVLDSRCKA